jgi:O-antigen/teichoic acid export membrane protein
MKENNLKTNVITSLYWKFLERGGVTGVQLVVQIILARLLFPADYGIIALIAVFITISQTFVQSGLGTALIQKKDVTDEDYSSVFYLSLGISLIFYCILFLTAPLVAAFYRQPLITPVLRVLGLTLFFSAVNSIQNAVISRGFQFRKLCICTFGAVVTSGIVGIAMAYKGFGVWALVCQQLIAIITLCLIMWFTVQWRPQLLFSLTRVKILFSFGWKLLASGLIGTTYNNISSLVIGKRYSASELGYYTTGKTIPANLGSNIDVSIQTVMFPAYAKHQDNLPRVKQIVRRAMVTSSFLVFPAMAGLAAIAEPLVRILLTDKWLLCVPFLQIFCVYYALWPVHTANLQAISALGHSNIFFRLEMIKALIGLAILVITIPLGIYAIALGMVITGIISMTINAYPNKHLLDYGITEQWKDLMPNMLLSIILFGFVYAILFLSLSAGVTLFLQILIGICVYLGLAWLFKVESLFYILNEVKDYLPAIRRSQ